MYLKLGLILLCCLGCSQFSSTDRSLLNHKAMDLNQRLLPKRISSLTTLEKNQEVTGGGACSACAY